MATLNSKEILCPECGDICKLKFNDFKITLYDCKSGHRKDNISFEQYNEIQKYKVNCINCNSNNCNSNNEENCTKKDNTKFFNCLTCDKNICDSCKNIHNKKHNLIEYKLRNYICNIHNKQFNSYCNKCKKNLCLICEDKHKEENDIIYYKDIITNINNIKNEELNLKYEKFNNDIKEIIKRLNKVMDNIQIYYHIYNDIINNYDAKYVNYQLLNNINEISCYNKKI